MNCPICNYRSEQFLFRPQVPVFQNFLFSSYDAALNVRRGDLNLHICGYCGFIFNAAFKSDLLEYGSCYDNTQTHSPIFSDYVNELISRIIDSASIRNSCIVEVGCGKGDFLLRLLQDPRNGNIGYGFDPSYTGPKTIYDGRAKFVSEYFTSKCADVKADVIVCRHVIEHVPNPVSMLLDLRSALKSTKKTLVFFETPDVNWILQNEVIWDLFYEHCSYFNPSSITTAFNKAGFQINNIHSTFGGQYMWIEARPMETQPTQSSSNTAILHYTQAFSKALNIKQSGWADRLMSLMQKGPVALWGAGAKGVTFANMIDPDHSRIDCVIDINPNKQGKFIPGTGHPIIGINHIEDRKLRYAILMNPNYLQESQAMLTSAGIVLELII